MKKKEVVKKKADFNSIIQTCPCSKNKFFNIYIRKSNHSTAHFGLAIGKKVGNAVVRNHLKRQVRAIIDLHKDIFSNDSDYIIMIKKDCYQKSFSLLEQSLVELIKERT